MLSVSVISGKGNKKAFKSLKCISSNTKKGIQDAFIAEKPILKKDAIDDMSKTKHGRDYFVYVSPSGRRLKRGRWHRASKVGESPAILSGALKRSLGFKIKRGKILTFGANTPYARRHELGGRSYIRRTLAKNAKQMSSRMISSIKKRQGIK